MLAVLSLFVSFAPVHAEAPLASASREDKMLFAQVKPLLLKEAAKAPLVLGKSKESYFWIVASRMAPLLTAYEYSGDPEFLEAFVPVMEHVLSQRYVHPTQPDVWSGWYHYQDGKLRYMPIHAAIAYYKPALRFVRAVRANPELQARYGAKAEAWFKDITEVSIPAWDKRGCWHDLGNGEGYYTHTTHYPDARTGRLVKRDDTYAGTTLAYNKVHAMIEAFCLLYRMTGDEWYRERIEKCERFFRNRWREHDDHVEWNYRDFSGPWDYVDGRGGKTKTGYFVHPKGGYYAADLRAIVQCYDLGIVFTRDDMEKLVKTNLEFMWMGDEQNPKFRKINGKYTEEGKYGKGYLWTALAHFSPKVRELWRTQIDNGRGGFGWATGMLGYLVETARPVSWEPRYVHEVPASD